MLLICVFKATGVDVRLSPLLFAIYERHAPRTGLACHAFCISKDVFARLNKRRQQTRAARKVELFIAARLTSLEHETKPKTRVSITRALEPDNVHRSQLPSFTPESDWITRLGVHSMTGF
jgi:hypothetical protein